MTCTETTIDTPVPHSPWTPAEDAVVVEALIAARGRVVAASRLCEGRISRSVHAIQRRMGGMEELRSQFGPIRRIDRETKVYAQSGQPVGKLQTPPPLPTLAALLAHTPRCPDCGGRWEVRRDLEGGGVVVCWQCSTERWWR